MDDSPSIASAVLLAVENIWREFNGYRREFDRITRRSRRRFEARDWHGAQSDARERLDLYSRRIHSIVQSMERTLGPDLRDKPRWSSMKTRYAERIADSPLIEIAATFFNSVTRRIFATVGIDPTIEFVEDSLHLGATGPLDGIHGSYPRHGTTTQLVLDILRAQEFRALYEDIERDARLAATEFDARRQQDWGDQPIERAEIIKAVFYRGQRAYIVGRLRGAERSMPVVLALLHGEGGVTVDAALVTENETSVVFSFTRSYLHVEARHPRELVRFLGSIMPFKKVAEMYIALGYNKHGKTELYRDLLHYLHSTSERFEIAAGEPGMVMVVFDMPSYDVVFKVIRDRFPPPKSTTRREVMDKYRLVFQHDRAGRLIDAQEFEHLTFDKVLFSDELLAELLSTAAETVTVSGDQIHIRHLYIERRIYPLNLYLREASPQRAALALVDYGQAIKDLASTNIFPGDLLLKNFGVTRHGRVIFYDYDELCLLESCNFRDMPQAMTYEDEMSAEPWFHVGPNDIFPEEFERFLGLPAHLREIFKTQHADLLQAGMWRQLQARHDAGELMDIQPYFDHRRLRRE